MDKKELAMKIACEYFKSSYAYTRLRNKKIEHDEEIVDEETFALHFLLVYTLAENEIEELDKISSKEEQILYLKNRLNQ